MSANEKWKLTDSEILKAAACEHQKFFLGCRAGRSTRFAVLDIDAKSKYHNHRELHRILDALATGGIKRSVLYRSSFSEGWHLYLFFAELVNSADLRRQLLHLLTLHDFDLAKGALEVFPHPGEGSSGQGLRLPLQPGWAWLNKDTLEVQYERSNLHPTQALESFIDDLTGDANSFEDFRALKSHVQKLAARREQVIARTRTTGTGTVIPIRRTATADAHSQYAPFVKTIFSELPPGIDPDVWYRGRSYHLSGLQGPSQRADAIFSLSHYFFYGDPSRELPALGYGYEEEREWAIKDFLATKNNGQSKDINHGRYDALSQVERAARWVPPHRRSAETTRYQPTPPGSWVRANINRKTDARKRITEALEGIKKLGRSFTTVELQEAAGCSRRTLYSHTDVWRKDYEDLAEGFFAICTGEYNAGVGADVTENPPPTPHLDKIAPPGLLAARRIASEISMRSKRQNQQAQRLAVRSQEVAETAWADRVAPLTREQPLELPVERIKLLLVVLAHYLSIAPHEEAATALYQYVCQLREELTGRIQCAKTTSDYG